MGERNQIHVRIGEIRLGKGTDLLKTTLGSCVGVAFLWKKAGRYGLAHCLLPEDPAVGAATVTGKYVVNAIPSLVTMMKITPEDLGDIEVYLAGGGNMMEQLSRGDPQHIGKKNVDMARRVLARLGLKVTDALTGGDQAHRMVVDCAGGTVEMSRLDRISMRD